MKNKILKIFALSLIFTLYITFLPLFASGIRYYSPNEEYYCILKEDGLPGSEGSTVIVKREGNSREIAEFSVDYTPQEISMDNSGRYIVLIGVVPGNKLIDFDTLPGISIFDLKRDVSVRIPLKFLVNQNRVRKYNGRIYWHDSENSGFLKNDNFFQICTRSGRKSFINLDKLEIEDYTKEVELFEMGWDH